MDTSSLRCFRSGQLLTAVKTRGSVCPGGASGLDERRHTRMIRVVLYAQKGVGSAKPHRLYAACHVPSRSVRQLQLRWELNEPPGQDCTTGVFLAFISLCLARWNQPQVMLDQQILARNSGGSRTRILAGAGSHEPWSERLIGSRKWNEIRQRLRSEPERHITTPEDERNSFSASAACPLKLGHI